MSHSVMFSGNGEVGACVGEASGVAVEEVCVGEASGIGEEEVCVGEASVVTYGNGDSTVAVSGKSKRTCTAEYPCVRRLRERRLLSYLWHQGHHAAFEALNHETTVALFSVQHMQRLVVQGRWEDALRYLNTYLPPLTENHKRSRRAQIFHNFLLIHYSFANAVAGNKGKHLEKQYAEGRWCSSHAELRFRAITYPILASEPQRLMDSFDWDKVRGHASFVVYILAEITPELRRAMPLPSSNCIMPQRVLPIGSRLHQRRHRVVKKQGPQKPDTDAIFMALKSQHHSSLYRESPDDALEMLVDYLDQTLQAGRRTGCSLIYAPQPSVKEGVPDAPDMQTMAGSSADNAKGHAASSVKFSCSPYFRFISGTLKVHPQIPGISSVTNQGTNKRLLPAGCHNENPSKGPTIVEDAIYQKKQRTTGAFGEASLASAFGGRASTDTLVNFMPKLSRVSSF